MNIPTSIKNIIFDFGGVILNIDYELTEKAFGNLGIINFKELYSQANQNQLFDRLEQGLISPANFRDGLRKIGGRQLSDHQIDNAWNAMLLDLPEERIHLIEKLKSKKRIFLLSNTNAIHHSSFSTYIQNKFNRDIFAEVFDNTYFSHKVHMRKPHAEIFELVLKENNLPKEDTLFIDDSIQHIQGAAKVGLKTLFIEKGQTILNYFN